MTTKELKKQFDKAYKMGGEEEYVYDILCEEANDYVSQVESRNLGKSMTDEEVSLLVTSYINGFFHDKRMNGKDWKTFWSPHSPYEKSDEKFDYLCFKCGKYSDEKCELSR